MSGLSFHADPNLFVKLDYRRDSPVPVLCLCSVNGLLNNTQLLCLPFSFLLMAVPSFAALPLFALM